MSLNPALGFFGILVLFIASGLFVNQVSNSNAHELIHRADKRLFNLGKRVYTSMLFGHHTSAHPLARHRFAASNNDPNSAEVGESSYTFARRAWINSARAGFEMESALMRIGRKNPSQFSHPYYTNGYCRALSTHLAARHGPVCCSLADTHTTGCATNGH